ncbi:MAG: hypothetical protein JW973_10000 [Bacteroidales bacterium]|nr:hypothetical protein [Bacteroidales bacterium]
MKRYVVILSILLTGSVLFAADRLFPEIPGWKLRVDPMVYSPDNLWEIIDGAAELYLDYDFLDLHLATYTGSPDREVRVELYHHATPENAYGIYTAERMPDYHFIEMGIQGYTGPGILHFFTGNYYIKIVSAGNIDVDEESLITIAGKISSSLNQTVSWPAETGFFPEEGKIYMSDAYIASNFMGYSFFHSAFTATYTANGEFTLFIMHGEAGEAEAMLKKYVGLMKEDKIEQRGDIFIVQDIFNGRIYLSCKADYLVGVMNAGDETVALEYIRKTMDRIAEEGQ